MCVRSVPASDSDNSVFSYRSIYQRYLECRKNKRNSINALKFEIDAESNLLELEHELKYRTYRPSRSILFAAKKPKLREIFASDFRDRVVHHILVRELENIWEPIFIHDSYACRVGKGTHKAVVRLKSFLCKITKNGNIRAYYLQLDIKDFFISINKNILFEILKKRVADQDLLWLIETVLFWDCTKSYIAKGDKNLLRNIPKNKSLFGKDNLRGLPIGNLTSQFFANVYLNELDQFVKHNLKVNYYLRYVDDFVILSHDKKQLVTFREEIGKFLTKKLVLRLHPRRRKLSSVSSGINFLGYIVRHNYVLVRRRVVNNLRHKLHDFATSGIRDDGKLRATIASYLGHFRLANSWRLTKEIIVYFEKIVGSDIKR
jgi:retron-type reverse transcriptase